MFFAGKTEIRPKTHHPFQSLLCPTASGIRQRCTVRSSVQGGAGLGTKTCDHGRSHLMC